MKKLKLRFELLQDWARQHRSALMTVGFLLTGVLAAWASSSPTPPPPADPVDVSTFIPRGYLLVPVEIRNAAQLEGVLSAHGIVDLYESSDLPGSKSRLVGRRLRLLRAPLNPRTFAVLVKEEEAERVLSFHGPFTASLRSSESASHEIAAAAKSGPRIEIQKED